MGARFYDPDLGRFLQVDPAREFWNSYSYVGNNPVRFVDLDGRDHSETIVTKAIEFKMKYSADFAVPSVDPQKVGPGDENSVRGQNAKGRYATNSDYKRLGFNVNKCNIFVADVIDAAYGQKVFPRNKVNPKTANQLGQFFDKNDTGFMQLKKGVILIEVPYSDRRKGDIVTWHTSDTSVTGGHIGIITTNPSLLSPGKATNAHTNGIVDDKFTSVSTWVGHLFHSRRAYRLLDKGDPGYDNAIKGP